MANISNGYIIKEGKDYKYLNLGSLVKSFNAGKFPFPISKYASARCPLANGDGFNKSSATVAPTFNKQPGPSSNSGTAITSKAPGPTSGSPALTMLKPSNKPGTLALPVLNASGALHVD